MAITKLKVDPSDVAKIAEKFAEPFADPFSIYADYWDKPVPAMEAIPDPERYFMIVRQVGKKRKVGSIILAEQTIADQDWTHGAAVVIKLGPSVYRGRKYEDMGLTPSDAPQPGTLVMFEARAPKRIKIDGELYLIIADDATFARPSLAELHRLAFTI